MKKELQTFGFTTTTAAEKLVHGVVQALARAADAGLMSTPSYPAYALARRPAFAMGDNEI